MRRRCRGFTLLEVLVAFLVLSLSLGVLMRIFSQSLGNIGAAADHSHALAVAESVLAGAGVETPLADGESDGADDRGYRWQLRMAQQVGDESAETAAAGVALYRVEVAVKAPAGEGDKPLVTLSSLRLAVEK